MFVNFTTYTLSFLQIEVDIDPPHSSSGLSDAKLEELGLPTHHVHFTAASSQQVNVVQ